MSSYPILLDDEDAATEPVVIIDDDDDDVVEKISDNQAETPIDTIVLDDDPTIENDFSKMDAIIHNKKHKKNKKKLNPHFLTSLKNNKLMDKIVTTCLNMDQNVGMARVINKTLLPLYKDTPVSYKHSGLFRKLLKNTYKLLVKDPDYKFLHIKTLCDEMKSGTIRRKVPFVTLATNLKHNGPDYGKEITSSNAVRQTQSNTGTDASVLCEKIIEVKDKSSTVIIENEDEENDCDVVIVENSEITTANNNDSLEGNKNKDSNIRTSISCDEIMDSDSSEHSDNREENIMTSKSHKISPAISEKEENNNRHSAANKKNRKETSAKAQSQLNPVNNENMDNNSCDESTVLGNKNTFNSGNFITIEVPQMLNSIICEEKTVLNKSAQENMGFVSIISESDNEINDSNVPKKSQSDKNKSDTEIFSCNESNKKSSRETETSYEFDLVNAINSKVNSINKENRLNLEIDAMKGIIRINSVTTKGSSGLKNTANIENKVGSKLRLVRNNRLKSVEKHSSVNLMNMKKSNRFDDKESKTVVNESAQKNMSFLSIISESDNDTNIHNNIPENRSAKRRKCETETNYSCQTQEETDVIDLIDSDNDSTANSNDSNNRNGAMIDKVDEHRYLNIINKENYMHKNADKESSNNNFGAGLLIPQNHIEVRINQVSPYQGISKETVIARLEKAIDRCKEKIAILETKEVTNDNATTSPYMQCCAYKKKIVEYYKMICDAVGDCEDLVKRREIRLHVTEGHPPGPAKTLEKFLNESIDCTGTVPFPDFTDVVECVVIANREDKLGWKKSRIVQEAAALFRQCGEALRKRRQKREYRDLLSIVKDEATDDPAETDPVLFAKLEANKHIAKVKEEEILERFVNMEMGCGNNSNMRLHFETNEDSNDSDTDTDADDVNTINDGESSSIIENNSYPVINTSNPTNTTDPISQDSNVVIDINTVNCPEINIETSDKREYSIQYEAIETNSYRETENNFTNESSHEENRVILTTSDNQKSSTNNETISNTINGVFENIGGESSFVENKTSKSENNSDNFENLDVKIETDIQMYTSNETISNTNNGVFENIGSGSSCVENDATCGNVQQNDDIDNLDVKIEKQIKLEPIDVQCMLDELGDSFVSTVFDIEDPFLIIEISSDGFSDDDL